MIHSFIALRLRDLFAVFLFTSIFLLHTVHAFAVNNLSYDGANKSVTMEETLSVPINIQTDDGTQVIGADVWLLVDESFIDVQSIEPGEYFPTVTGQKTSTGKIYIAGILEDTTSASTGDGTIATVLFTPKKTGTTQIRFDCRGNNVSDTSKININFQNPQNVIDCSSTVNNVLTVNITQVGAQTTPTPADGADLTATPAVYMPGDGGELTPTPSVLPDSGFFDYTVYYALSGGALLGLGGLMRRLYQ